MLLLDTNVISELRKVALGKANTNVQQWALSMSADEMYLSAITIHELEIGIFRLKRRNAFSSDILRRWMDNYVLTAFIGHIVPVDTAVARRAATLHHAQTRPWADAFIAATALVHGMIVVTRDTGDFQPMGVPVLNPFTAPGSA